MANFPQPVKKLSREYFKTIAMMLTSAFGLVAALAWNDLVKRIIDNYVRPGSDVISQLIYALVITTLVVIFTVWIGRVAQSLDEKK